MRTTRFPATRPIAILLLAWSAMTASALPAGAQAGLDHSTFDALLHSHVRNGMVDYDAFAGAPEFGSETMEAGMAALAGSGRVSRRTTLEIDPLPGA